MNVFIFLAALIQYIEKICTKTALEMRKIPQDNGIQNIYSHVSAALRTILSFLKFSSERSFIGLYRELNRTYMISKVTNGSQQIGFCMRAASNHVVE